MLTIDNSLLCRVQYDDIQPGDLLCSYEHTTTRTDLLGMKFLLDIASFGQKKELNRMFHTQIVLKAYPRSGVFQVAHADGSVRKITTQDDWLQEHNPGQALLIFRAKDPDFRKQILQTAQITSREGNGHLCKTLAHQTLPDRLKLFANMFLFQHFGQTASLSTLKTLSEMAVNFDETGRFYSENGSGTREMRCVEYVANVVNIAYLKYMENRSPTIGSRQERIERVFERLKILNQNSLLPLKLSYTNATTASFADFFLKQRELFETVGYVGAVSDQMEGPYLETGGELRGIAIHELASLISNNPCWPQSPDLKSVISVMIALHMMNESGHLHPLAFLNQAKNETLCAYFSEKSLNERVVLAKNSQWREKAQAFSQACASWVQNLDQSRSFAQKPEIEPLSPKQIKEVLALEKEFIKNHPFSRAEKTLYLSLNSLAFQEQEINQIKALASQFLSSPQSLLSKTLFYPIQCAPSLFSRLFQKLAIEKKKECTQTRSNLLTAYERVRKNGRIFLNAFQLPSGYRPWLHYSKDEGRSFDVEPFTQTTKGFEASVVIEPNTDLIYKIFIGPEDVKDLDPLSKAQIWQNTNGEIGEWVPYHQMIPFSENDRSHLQIGCCENVQWTHPLVNYDPNPIDIYFQKCNAIAPTEDSPSKIQEYEESFAKLESHLEPIDVFHLPPKEQMNQALISFVKKATTLELEEKNFHLLPGGLGKGLSGDLLYRVEDGQGRSLMVIKSFLKSKGKFTREFHSLMNHKNLDLKQLHLPQVLGIGATEIDGKRIYFLALSYVPGVSFHSQFQNLIQHPPLSPKRMEAFSLLKRSYEKLGAAFAEFHSSTTTTAKPPHPAFLNLIQLFTFHAMERLKDHLEPDLLKQLTVFLETTFQNVKGKFFERGYLHGDLNAGNAIMNFVTDELTVLDWPDGSLSIGKDREPTGVSDCDIIQIRNELLTRLAFGVSKEEIEDLFITFRDEYLKTNSIKIDLETKRFFSCIDLMGSLKWFLDKKDRFDPSQLSIAESIFSLKKERLKHILNSDDF